MTAGCDRPIGVAGVLPIILLGAKRVKRRFFVVAAFALVVNGSSAVRGESRTFDAGTVKIHFLVEGSGETVVLIHGLHSTAQINWVRNGVFAELAKDHQVVALDLPGHGQSSKPTSDDAYGLALVTDVVRLLDHLKIEKAHIVGYSLGGMVAAKLLATHPQRTLSGLIGGMGWLRQGSRLQRIWAQMPAREEARTPPAFVRNVGNLALSEQEILRIRVPVEVVVGDRDPVKGLYVAPLRRFRPDWPIIEIHDAGHLNCIVKDQFRREIAAWVRKQSLRK